MSSHVWMYVTTVCTVYSAPMHCERHVWYISGKDNLRDKNKVLRTVLQVVEVLVRHYVEGDPGRVEAGRAMVEEP